MSWKVVFIPQDGSMARTVGHKHPTRAAATNAATAAERASIEAGRFVIRHVEDKARKQRDASFVRSFTR